MKDEFSEWDRFYASYEATLTPEEAYQRYRKKRKKEGTLPKKRLTKAEWALIAYKARVEKRRVEALKSWADNLARESALRASKSTTRG